jgi:hypothetical protein
MMELDGILLAIAQGMITRQLARGPHLHKLIEEGNTLGGTQGPDYTCAKFS